MAVRPTLASWLVIGLIAVTFILVFKWGAVKFNIPYAKDLAATL